MNSLMPRTIGAPPEGFPTHPAFKRFLLSVKSLMVRKMGATAKGPPTVAALIQRPHHVKTPWAMRTQAEVLPVHILRGPFQSSVNSLGEAKRGQHASEALPVLLVVIAVRARSEESAAAMLPGSLSSGNSQICHMLEIKTIAASCLLRFLSCAVTETALFFLSTQLDGISTWLL